jgi:SAM-dependent methyltransferase
MPTHQSITGSTDEQLLERMICTHAARFDPAFWAIFDAHVAPHVPPRGVIVDVGCGPGLLLRDLRPRVPEAKLYGYDVTPAMIAHARELTYAGTAPTLAVHDVVAQPLPHADGSVDLLCMSSVLHVLDEPYPVLAEIGRVLAPRGVFLLIDWIRQSLAAYLAWRRDVVGETHPGRGFRLFPVHNKYTAEDWLWLLAQAGFEVGPHEAHRASHRVFVARRHD